MNKIQQLLNNKILKNSIVLINGTIISQIINIIMSPFMSRLYSPDDFGKYSTLTAIIIIATVIVNGKYDLAIMESKDNEKERKATYYGGMILTICSCIAIILIGSFLVRVNTIQYNYLEIFIIAVFTFFSSNNSIINIWLNKNGLYKQISKNRIIYSMVNFVGIILFGIMRLGYFGIIFSTFLAYVFQFIYIYVFLYKKTEFNKYKYNGEEVKNQLKKHIKFPKFQMPALLLNNASTQIPILMFNNFWGNEMSGWYSMTVKIINLPMTVVGSAIGEVFYKEASEIYANEKERLKSFTYKTFRNMAYIGLIPMCILVSYGDILFSFVLGEQWKMSGIYAMILSPWYYMILVTSPFTHLFTILNKQNKNLVVNIIMLVSRIIAILTGFLCWSTESIYTIITFSIVGFIILTFLNGYLFKMIGIPYKDSTLKTVTIFILASVITSMPRLLFNVI